MNTLDNLVEREYLPLNFSTFYRCYADRKFHGIRGIRVSFNSKYYDYESTHSILSEWFGNHKRYFNSVWLQPEYYPTTTPKKYSQIHYHGYIDYSDYRGWRYTFLNLVSSVMQVHYFEIENPEKYKLYVLKEVGQTECMNYIINTIRSRKRALKQDNTK